MFLDFFDCHARVYGNDEISLQNSQIMQRFFSMLESGVYKEHRDIGYFASELCITSKYLSEICRKITGMSANFWINRFTIMDINRQLKARTKSLVEIADEFNFSSQAYFTRYVQNYLGQIPSNYR
jgi:AraC-like DNA-binding protein